jgi:hypothetical protein
MSTPLSQQHDACNAGGGFLPRNGKICIQPDGIESCMTTPVVQRDSALWSQACACRCLALAAAPQVIMLNACDTTTPSVLVLKQWGFQAQAGCIHLSSDK